MHESLRRSREGIVNLGRGGWIRDGTTRESLSGVNLNILDVAPVVDKRVCDPTDDR